MSKRVVKYSLWFIALAVGLMFLRQAHLLDEVRAKNVHLVNSVSGGASPELIRKLIKEGASPDSPDRWGTPVLLLAIETNHTRIARVLLEAGASPDIRSRRPEDVVMINAETDQVTPFVKGETALTCSASFGPLELVEMLLNQGATVNQTDGLGRTALMRAAERGRLDVVTLLLERRADPTIPDQTGLTAADHARKSKQPRLVELLSR